MKIRYGLLRYMYTNYIQTAMYGGAFVTPFLFEYPYDPYAFQYLDTEFMFGKAIIVAPVLLPNVT